MKKLLKVKNKSCKVDVEQLTILLDGALRALEDFEAEINRLNVFPVPDGDTGTNIKLTFKAMLDEVTRAQPVTISDAAAAMIKGSLFGARGNSGVILSQIVKGFCEVIAAANSLAVPILAEALMRGADTAFEAVREPIDGTILTVIRDVSTTAAEAECQPDIFLEKLALAARISVDNTPNLLPVLKESGVVDAGGYGLAVIFAGISAAWSGREVKAESRGDNIVNVELEDINYAYCTEFLLEINAKSSTHDFAEQLECLGGSTLFVGDEDLYRVHIHTDEPGKVIDMATNVGSISRVEIHNLALQSRARADALAKHSSVESIGLIALVNGGGIEDVLKSLGVTITIRGGQSANPAAVDFFAAINKISASEIIILPNNKSVILAAEQGAELSDKIVRVVPTRSIPEAIAALLVFDSELDIDANYKAMAAASATVKSLAVTRAV